MRTEMYETLIADFHRAETILAQVAEDTGVSVEHLRGPARRRPFTTARQIAMWRLRQEGVSCTEISRALNRDHTTVLHGCRRIDQKLGATQ